MLKTTDLKVRNTQAREKIVQVVEGNGLRWDFVAKNMNVPQSTISHWRRQRFNFTAGRLRCLENFMQRYK